MDTTRAKDKVALKRIRSLLLGPRPAGNSQRRDRTMTLEEIKQRHPNQWVLIEFSKLDDELKVIDGKVIAHSRSRKRIEKKLATLRNEKIAIEFTGEGDGGAWLI